MSVLCEALSVIIPKANLEAAWRGGVSNYAGQAPNRTFCEDEHLTRVGFQTPADVQRWIDRVSSSSQLRTYEGTTWLDMVVVDQLQGPTGVCSWLAFDRVSEVSRAWLRGSEPGAFVAPPGWEPAEFEFLPNEVADGFVFSRSSRRGVDACLDQRTGKVRFVATARPEEDRLLTIWAQHLVDEVDARHGAPGHLMSTMSSQHVATTQVEFLSPAGFADGIREVTDDLRARETLDGPIVDSIGVAVQSCGELDMTLVGPGGVEAPVQLYGHYLIAAHPGLDPFVVVQSASTSAVTVSRRLPRGTESTFQALDGLLDLLASRRPKRRWAQRGGRH